MRYPISILLLIICTAFPVSLIAQLSIESQQRARNYFSDDVLVDQDGTSQRFYSDWLKDRVVLINVIFTHCEDACPMQTQKLKHVQKELGNHFPNDINFLSLSVDPIRDTPQTLKAYALEQGADHPGWRFLVAEPEVMKKILSRLGQWANQPESHSTLLIAGNTQTARWIKLRPDSPSESIALNLIELIN